MSFIWNKMDFYFLLFGFCKLKYLNSFNSAWKWWFMVKLIILWLMIQLIEINDSAKMFYMA